MYAYKVWKYGYLNVAKELDRDPLSFYHTFIIESGNSIIVKIFSWFSFTILMIIQPWQLYFIYKYCNSVKEVAHYCPIFFTFLFFQLCIYVNLYLFPTLLKHHNKFINKSRALVDCEATACRIKILEEIRSYEFLLLPLIILGALNAIVVFIPCEQLLKSIFLYDLFKDQMDKTLLATLISFIILICGANCALPFLALHLAIYEWIVELNNFHGLVTKFETDFEDKVDKETLLLESDSHQEIEKLLKCAIEYNGQLFMIEFIREIGPKNRNINNKYDFRYLRQLMNDINNLFYLFLINGILLIMSILSFLYYDDLGDNLEILYIRVSALAAVGFWSGAIIMEGGQKIENTAEDLILSYYSLPWYYWNHNNQLLYFTSNIVLTRKIQIKFTSDLAFNYATGLKLVKYVYSATSVLSRID